MKLDFPFYNDKNIKITDIIILAIMPVLYTIYSFFPFNIPFHLGAFIFCFSQLTAFLIVARGKISLLIKKPSFKDFLRVIATLILQYVVAILLTLLLRFVFNITPNGNAVFDMKMNFIFWIQIIVQLFGEELYKILIFLAVLTIVYKISKKRSLAIFIGLTVSLCLFALLHATTYNNIAQIFLLQGLASLCCYYNYLKTKNILTSYLQHLLFDAIPFILAMVGVMK